MSRYLEEAAALLRKAAESNEKSGYSQSTVIENHTRIAREFATLAAIDKGLLPADLTGDLIDKITRTHA